MPTNPDAPANDREKARIAGLIRNRSYRDAAQWVKAHHPDVWADICRNVETSVRGVPAKRPRGSSLPPPRPPRRGGHTPKPREHGTPLGYQQHLRNNELTCAECRAAIHEYQKRFPSQQPGYKRNVQSGKVGRPRKPAPPATPSPWPPPSLYEQVAKVMTDGLNSGGYPAPPPGRLHRCTPYLSGVDDGRLVERCLCGAIRFDERVWINRNSRRKAGR